MRRIAFLAALSFLVPAAKAQMWDALATSSHRIDSASVGALRVEVDNLDFFRDNEYNSVLCKGYSLPGLWVQPKLVYTPLDRIEIELGCHALIFNGANKYPCYAYQDIGMWKGNQYQRGAHVLPWVRAKAQFRHLTIVLGDIYGGQNHGFVVPLYNPEANLSQDPEMGVQLLWDRARLHSDTWINWQSYIFNMDTHQEAFTVGSNWRALFNGEDSKVHWYMPAQLVIQHRGGEQDTTDMGVQTICNLSLGAGMRWNTGKKTLMRLGAQANVVLAYQQSGKMWPFNEGVALHAHVDAALLKNIGLQAGVVHAPRHFVSLYGNKLFNTLSVIDGTSVPKLTAAYLRADYCYPFAKGYAVGVEAEACQGMLRNTSETNFSFGVYMRVNPGFTVWRKR